MNIEHTIKSFFLFGILILFYNCQNSKIENDNDLSLKLGFSEGHFKPTSQILLSPSGKYILTASGDYTSKLWDVDTKKLIHTYKNHSSEVLQAIYSNNEKYILTGTEEGNINLFDMESGYLIKSFLTHTDSISHLEFSKDNGKILSSSMDGTVKLHNSESGKILWDNRVHNKGVTSAVFNKDDTKVITSSRDGKSLVIDSNSGIVIDTLFNNKDYSLNTLKFSPDYSYLAFSSNQNIFVYDGNNFKPTYQSNDHKDSFVLGINFSHDESWLTSSASDSTANIYDLKTGNLYRKFKHDLEYVQFSKFDKYDSLLITGAMNWDSWNSSYSVYDINKGKLLFKSKESYDFPSDVAILENTILVPKWSTIDELDLSTHQIISTYGINSSSLKSLSLSNDKKGLFGLFDDALIHINFLQSDFKNLNSEENLHHDPVSNIVMQIRTKIQDSITRNDFLVAFDLNSNKQLWKQKQVPWALDYGFSDDFKLYHYELNLDENSAIYNPGTIVYDVLTGSIVYKSEILQYVDDLKKTSNGYKLLTSESYDTGIQVASLEQDEILTLFKPGNDVYVGAKNQIYNDSLAVLATSIKELWLYDFENTCIQQKFIHNDLAMDMHISNKKDKLLVGYEKGVAKMFDMETGIPLITLKLENQLIRMARFSNDERFIVIGCEGGLVNIYEAKTGDIVKSINTLGNVVTEVQFDENTDSFYFGTQNGYIIYYNVRTDQQIKFLFLDNDPSKWVFIHPSGLFDASPDAMELMYWTKGLEIIKFSQLKDRYWLPGLFKKVLSGEVLPDVRDMNELKLQPMVALGEIKNDKLPIHLTKRDGGYGNISIFINGKEVINDARGDAFDLNKEKQTIYYNIKNHPYLKDGDNEILVKASSSDGFVQGRGSKANVVVSEKTTKLPQFFGIIIGIEEYANEEISLSLPNEDAEAVTKSISMGANNLFGEEHTNIYTLTTKDGLRPNKKNIKSVFEEIATKANAEDIIFIYLSGHGITWGSEGSGDFYYLTADATSASKEAYNDPTIRNNNAIASEELVEWLKEINALKQVMIIDACGSGKAVDNLIASRDIDPSQLKAIDRMKDRTGMFIISGSAADAVSYEASIYGQGLLTYSILQAMKGAALKENRYMDISTIMEHALETVPELAREIGGIQKPHLLKPKNTASFDIGILEEKDRDAIPLNNPKKVFVRSNLIDRNQYEDVLGISDALDKELSLVSTKGVISKNIVFFDAKQYPNSCKISGPYTNKNGTIKLNLKIRCDKIIIEKEIVSNSISNLIQKILNEIEDL